MLLDGLTGQESQGHDWYNLLDRWGLLEHDTAIARWMRMITWLMCVRREHRRRGLERATTTARRSIACLSLVLAAVSATNEILHAHETPVG